MLLKNAIYGFAAGDALGVPVEFNIRDKYRVTGMTSGGVFGKETGTWSDDTSMTIATCASIKKCKKVDTEDIRKNFEDWFYNGAFTPAGETFGVGNTTKKAITEGHGQKDILSNGNGALMRILPLAFVPGITEEEIREVASITHGHEISLSICIIYVKTAINLINGKSKEEAVIQAVKKSKYEYLADMGKVKRENIKSSAYVVDTIEAVFWSFLSSSSYKETVLKAVNLGDDTDTIAAIAGGLAGIYYGYDEIPEDWIKTLKNKKIIENSLFKF